MNGVTITMSANKRTLWESTKVTLPIIGEVSAFEAMEFIASSCKSMVSESYKVPMPKLVFTLRQRATPNIKLAENIHFDYGGLFHFPDAHHNNCKKINISLNYKYNDLTKLATTDLTTPDGDELLHSMMSMICHELIHAKQFLAGELSTSEGDYVWNGERVSIDTPYMDQPHEIEAHDGMDYYAQHMMAFIQDRS